MGIMRTKTSAPAIQSFFSQLSFIPFADNFFSANVFYAQSRFLSAMPHISFEETKENPFETKI